MVVKGKGVVMSEKSVERFILYRRVLQRMRLAGETHVFSHDLAGLAGNAAAQVRRDLMTLGASGSVKSGYLIDSLLEELDKLMLHSSKREIVLVGVGNLGRALLAYFNCQQSRFHIKAAFDSDMGKAGRVIAGCRCYHFSEFAVRVREMEVSLGILTVPGEAAQGVVDLMVEAGIRGILNFAPVPPKVPGDVYLEQVDITMSLEKVGFFADGGRGG